MVNNLKVCRIKPGLSQKDVATLLGIATSTYSSWETVPDRIKIKNAKELAVIWRKFGCFIFKLNMKKIHVVIKEEKNEQI